MWQCVLTAPGKPSDSAVCWPRLLSLALGEEMGRLLSGKLEKRREKTLRRLERAWSGGAETAGRSAPLLPKDWSLKGNLGET